MGKNKNIANAKLENNAGERKRNIGHLSKVESRSPSDKSINETNRHKKDKTHAAIGSKKSEWPKKEFKLEYSHLTVAFQNLDIRCIRHLSCVVWIMWIVRLIIIDCSNNEPFQIPGIRTLLEACNGCQYWLLSHIILFICAVIVCFGFQIWYSTRKVLSKPSSKIFDYACVASMVAYMSALLFVPWWWVLTVSEQGAFIKECIVGEQVRIYMKLIAFLSTKIRQAREETEATGKKNKNLPQRQDSGGARLSKLVYFLYAPTLIYSDEYPRNTKIRWSFVLEHLVELILIFYTGFVVLEKELQPAIRSYLLEQKPNSFVLLIFQTSLPFLVMLFLGITALWHSMQNLFAEILRFGDRRFYLDWWNEGTPAGFHRSNNVVVQDWLFYYVYYPVKRHTGSRSVAQLAVLVLSGVVHDIMLGLALGFGIPLVLGHFLHIGITLHFFKSEKKRDALSNFLYLIFFPPGASFMGCFLGVEYLARQECHRVIESGWDYFCLRVLNCTLKNSLVNKTVLI